MRTGVIVAAAVAVIGAAVALYVGVPAYEAREQRASAENQKLLMVAIKEKDLATVTILAQRRVDIYATDKTGESALSLAEQSGDQRILDALAPRRDRATDVARVHRAVELGYSVGLQPPPREPEFNVHNFIRDQTARALAEKQPTPTPDELADITGRAIAALPEGDRKQWAWRNLTIYLYSAGLLSRAQDLAVQLSYPEMRGEMLISILQHSTGTTEVERSYALAKSEIDKIADPSVRDPLSAQLAHFAGLRGLPAENRTGTIAPQLHIAPEPPHTAAVVAPDTGPTSVAADDGCGILRLAGAYDLIGTGKGEQWSRKYEKGGFECRVWRNHDVQLIVIPAPESQFEQLFNKAQRLTGYEFKVEAGLGARRYAIKNEGNLSFVAFKDGQIVQLNFVARGVDPARLRDVFARVLEQI